VAAPAATPAAAASTAAAGSGLTLVHFSAQLESFLTQKHTLNTPQTPCHHLNTPKQPLSAPLVTRKALILS